MPNRTSLSIRRGSVANAASVFLAILVAGGVAMLVVQGSASKEKAEAATAVLFDRSMDVEGAMRLSAESGRPLYVLATADWCGPCQQFKGSTLADDEVVGLLQSKTVPFYLDVTSIDAMPADERRLVESLGVTSIPASFVLSDGQVRGKLVGGGSTSAFKAWVQQSVSAD